MLGEVVRKREKKFEKRRDRILAKVAGDIAAVLKPLGAERIIIFGSVLKSTFREISDVDIAVKGIAADNLLEAAELIEKALEKESTDFDLLRIEDMHKGFRSLIESRGRVIYEKTRN